MILNASFEELKRSCYYWVLPPLSNSWIINILELHIALNRTPNIDCYWVGAVPNVTTMLNIALAKC